MRTPVIVNWPWRVKPGRFEDLVCTIDIAPTVLGAAGLKSPPEMAGVDLLPRAAGGKPLERKAVFGEIYVHTAKNLAKPPVNVTHLWVREGKWKLIVPVEAEGGAAELYDLAADPHERSNLAANRGDVVTSLRAQLDTWRREWQ